MIQKFYKSVYEELDDNFIKELKELKKSQEKKEEQLKVMTKFQKTEYSYKFTKLLKERIKKRDNYECQFPDCKSKDDLTTHHINFLKKDCQENNLITLCRKHNSFVNKIEEREYWKTYFMGVVHYKIKR